METKHSAAKSFASLAIGLWTVSLIGHLTGVISGLTYFLVAVGAVSALFGSYLVMPWRWAQESTLELLKRRRILRVIELLGWFLVVVIFGVGLMQSKIGWMIVAGLIAMIIALIVFYVGIFMASKGQH